MKCFYHPERDAVALCKSCNRGLCLDCLVDVPPGVACRERCEADVAALNMVLERSKTAYQKTGIAFRRNAIAMLIIGLVFVGFGILPVLISQNYGAIFLALIGAIFLLWSVFSYRSSKQFSEAPRRSDPGVPPMTA